MKELKEQIQDSIKKHSSQEKEIKVCFAILYMGAMEN